jgi:hypothetical protein
MGGVDVLLKRGVCQSAAEAARDRSSGICVGSLQPISCIFVLLRALAAIPLEVSIGLMGQVGRPGVGEVCARLLE